jgi:hypothetical protein
VGLERGKHSQSARRRKSFRSARAGLGSENGSAPCRSLGALPAGTVTTHQKIRCESFLRVVRDDRGAVRAQYRDDELIVKRFEQCLSGDVLADTIPNRNLPFTGGMSLLFLAAIGLAAIVAGVSVLRAVMRRGG